MIFSRAWFALMRRNLIYFFRRNWLRTLLEIGLPVGFVGVLVGIKSAVEGTSNFEPTVHPAYFPDQTDVFTPFSFSDYVTAMQVTRKCVLNEAGNYFDITGFHGYNNWPVPMIKCDKDKCEEDDQNATDFCELFAVGLAGVDAAGKQRAQDMKVYMEERYPALVNGNIRSEYSLIKYFNDVIELDDYVRDANYGSNKDFPKLAVGIVWEEGNDDKHYRYQLRQNSTNMNDPNTDVLPADTTTPDTTKLFESYAKDDTEVCSPLEGSGDQRSYGSSCTGQYMYNGIITFQRLVGDFVLNHTGAAEKGYSVAEAGVSFVPFPSPSYEEEGFYEAISVYAPFLILLGLFHPVASMIAYICKEKELRQKELMKMMSVTESDIGWSWFVSFLLLHSTTTIATTFVSLELYENSEGIYMFLFWFYTFIATISLTMALSTLTAKTVRAVMVGILVLLIGFFLSMVATPDSASSVVIGLLSLHPITSFSYGIQEVGRLEDLGVGLTQDSIRHTDEPSGYTFQDCLNSLVISSFFWGFWVWYLNRVIPPDYGQALPVYFPFTASYWCPECAAVTESTDDDDSIIEPDVPLEPVTDALERQSELGENIEIRKLMKVFGKQAAVSELNLTMYRGEITALVGHNGAGKTTTIAMLTGALAPTQGYAKVVGKDIRTQMHLIRQDIGICLQHNCLFPDLTVREHIQFFSRIKGLYDKVSRREAERQVDETIRDVALFEKRDALSKNLSGGMKRKLSVAMAFCGGSEVVLLDEPTSGMDPFARRFTWNVIRQYRRDRCIILTTHCMDEADILGDRIAIMSEGQLRCAGSSLFLKKTYGVGYQLTIEKIKGEHGNLIAGKDTTIEENDSTLMEIVQSAVPKASLLTNVGSELSYQLPMASSSEFPVMFESLDREIETGGISSYGVSITTLDEVFLLVARGDTKDKTDFPSSKHLSERNPQDDTKSAHSSMDLEQDSLFTRHVTALLKKRAAFFRRDKKAWICTTILPSLFVLWGFLIFKYVDFGGGLEPLVLDLNDYNMNTEGVLARNPIAFNNPGTDYVCQPGNCVYMDVFNDISTDETYHFCGSEARLNGGESCSIHESDNYLRWIAADGNEAGATLEGVDVGFIQASSESLFNSSSKFGGSQYGAVWFTHDRNSVTSESFEDYSESAIAVCETNSAEASFISEEDCGRLSGIGYVVHYNYTGLHVSPLFQSLADEALLREATKDDGFKIDCTISPLPVTKVEDNFKEAFSAYDAWFLVVLSFPFIGSAFAAFIVAERESKAKHMQVISGVKPAAYWLSTFLWDTVNYQIPLWITIALMFIFDVDVFTSSEGNAFSGVFTILFFYGPASAGYAYCASFAFKSPSMCSLVLIITGFLIGMGGPVILFFLLIVGEGDDKQNLIDAAKSTAWALRVFFPSFNLGYGLFNVINIEAYRIIEEDPDISAWHDSILKFEAIFLVLQTFFYLGLAIALDILSTNPRIMSVFHKIVQLITCQVFSNRARGVGVSVALPDDDDVIAEQERVLSGDANDDLIVINELNKIYDTGDIAVNNISLGIPRGECFGLLGINGAGKTTAMCMLTAEFPPTHGDATLAGYSVTREPSKTRRRIGYCPQFDAHFANLTGREHVELYASIKGVPLDLVREASAAKLRDVGLNEDDWDRLSADYSGGMKRRLSLACATIGQPQILFLDECSTGVDPVARREIWQLISDMVEGQNVPESEKTSVILTTHSMEECEALCPRIGIMANGRLRCLGSAQHLKNKFGQGYQVEMKAEVIAREDDDYVANAIALASTSADLASTHEGDADNMAFSLPQALVSLRSLSGDNFLTDMVNEDNPSGIGVWKDATSQIGVALDTLAAFATTELRMRSVNEFVKTNFPNHLLRERQDNKARYEVASQGVLISSLFAKVEANKEQLHLSDYSVSQTSLEQVFNMHAAAEAARLKEENNGAV